MNSMIIEIFSITNNKLISNLIHIYYNINDSNNTILKKLIYEILIILVIDLLLLYILCCIIYKILVIIHEVNYYIFKFNSIKNSNTNTNNKDNTIVLLHDNNYITINPIQINNNNKNYISINTLSILSYNILSQTFMKRKELKNILTNKYRINLIIKEIAEINCDIINLQEVTTYSITNLNKAFSNSLTKAYKFMQATNQHAGFFNCTGYNKNRFKLVESKSLALKNFNNNFDLNGNRGVHMVVLKDLNYKGTGNKGYIGGNTGSCSVCNYLMCFNVHMPWRPDNDLEKCFILNEIFKEIIDYTEDKSSSNNSNNSNTGNSNNSNTKNSYKLIISGDMNSLPNSLLLGLIYYEPLYNIILQNFNKTNNTTTTTNKNTLNTNINNNLTFLYIDLLNNRNLFNKHQINLFAVNQKYKDFMLETFVNSKFIYDKFKLKSAYENYTIYHNQNSNFPYSNSSFKNHPAYTNFTHNFKNTIDYIFYSSISFSTNRVLKLPEYLEMTKELFLPNTKYPSDHIKISSRLEYK